MKPRPEQPRSLRVVIIGAGFGGLYAARELSNRPVDVLLLDRNNYHLFFPLLYQVATAGLEPEEIAYPVRAALRRARNITVRRAEATGLDLDGRRVLLEGHSPVAYDTLILALGSAHQYFGIPGVREHAVGMKSLEEALAIRNRVLSAFEHATWEEDREARAAWMTVVIIGGGPTGVEMAGALIELLRHVVPRDFRDLDLYGARIVLVEAADRLLATFPPTLQANALAKLSRMGVEVRLRAGVVAATAEEVRLSDGSTIRTRTLIWAAGVKAADLERALPGPRERGGRIPVLPTLQLASHPEVFVVGDLAHFPDGDGEALPMLASVACQQGTCAGRNILRIARGLPPVAFRYRDWGLMATIGRSAAVAVLLGGLRLTGWFAWLSWLVYHLVRLIGFRNRANVLVNWIHNYFTYERGARLILGERSLPPLESLEDRAGAASPRPAARIEDSPQSL